jgi:ComF family protein
MKIKMTIFIYLKAFLRLFFPILCRSCGSSLSEGEKVLCIYCESHLPRTNYHREDQNTITQIFWGRVEVEYATAFLHFHRGNIVRKLLHDLKYRGFTETGYYLGRIFAWDLLNDGAFRDIEAVIPVPLHPKKKKKRGFNQSAVIAAGMARELKLPVLENVLIRRSFSSTQTRKSRMERWANVKDIFEVQHPEILKDRHVLLVDDVITTGATTEACLQALKKVPGIRLSAASIAYTSR